MACISGASVNGDAAAPRKSFGLFFISRPSRYIPSSRILLNIQSICTESTSIMFMLLLGAGPTRGLSPERQSILFTPMALAPIASDCRLFRLLSRADICITGSAPSEAATAEHAALDIRGTADDPSVKLIAET